MPCPLSFQIMPTCPYKTCIICLQCKLEGNSVHFFAGELYHIMEGIEGYVFLQSFFIQWLIWKDYIIAVKFHIMQTGYSLHHSPFQVADKVKADLLHHYFWIRFWSIRSSSGTFWKGYLFYKNLCMHNCTQISYTYFQNIPPLHCSVWYTLLYHSLNLQYKAYEVSYYFCYNGN